MACLNAAHDTQGGHDGGRISQACLPNGPLYLLNDPAPHEIAHLVKSDGSACSTVAGVALCRCGVSKNKPFCDGTHWRTGFRDEKN